MNMDPQMQQKCNSKLRELQECMPFLLRVLERLRNNNKNDIARQTQLEKIQKLYNLLNDRTQTFKWDLLVKCENVVKKLQRKMELQGETELFLRSRTFVEENNRSISNMDRDDLGCPESPPPQQQMEYCDNIQPVVIPTERRCSPPILSNHREIYKPVKEKNGERRDRKHSHTSHHNHHKHDQRSASKEVRSSLRDDDCFIRRDPYKSHNEHDQNAIIDRYLSAQRQREEENRESFWQRRDQNLEAYTQHKTWPQQPNTHDLNNSNVLDIHSTTQQTRKSVFSRLGEKVKDCESDSTNKRLSQNLQNLNENKDSMSSNPYTTPNQLTMTAKETLPIVPDFLKSPPLTANDITLLLNESNTNSNSNSSDLVSISEIGTRRNTKATSTISNPTSTKVDATTSLDIVRKKFALLTKTETSIATSPSSNDATSFSKAIAQNEKSQTTLTQPTDRFAVKYYPHSRAADKSTSPSPSTIVPNTNVNVLPTLYPNDPRLRKSNIANGSTSTLPTNKHIPNLMSLQVTPPSAAKPVPLLSPISNFSATPSTPSPIYGSISSNTHSLTKSVANSLTNQTKINDPRLQRSKTPVNLHTAPSQKRNLLIAGDSSDENWDLDDNDKNIFPKPRPFPNQNPTHSQGNSTLNVSPQSGMHHLGNTHARTVSTPRPSAVWDRVSQPINNAITPSSRITNNVNFQGSIPNIEDPKSFHNTNRNTGPTASPTLNYNVTSFKHTAVDRFNALQNNIPTEYPNYSIPRTYGAYKEARARAAAEEAARKGTKKNTAQKTAFETEQNKDSTEAEPKLAGSTNLDTTYRSTNLSNSELPKTIENFKIPKKPVVIPLPEKEEKSVLESIEKTKTTVLKKVEDVGPSKSREHRPSKGESTENKKTCSDSNTNSKSTTVIKDKMEPLQPKTQRQRFNKKHTNDQGNFNSSKDHKSISPIKTTSELNKNVERFVVDEVAGTDSEPELIINEEPSPKKPLITSPRIDLLADQPRRILKRRCTMIDKASAPEVDKEKLLKTNAMLFEDLQERERKKKTESANKVHAPNRRQGEICYEKTDDGCTVSTQNIISGKRRTRTTANFNEVQQAKAVFKHIKTSETKKDRVTTTTSPVVQPTKERKRPGPKPKIKQDEKVEQDKGKMMAKQVEESSSKIKKRRMTLVDIEIKPKLKEEDEKEEKSEISETLPNVTSIFDTFIQKILNPATNADELINKLRDILSEKEVEALLSLREVMMKKNSVEHGTDKASKDVSKVENKPTKETITNEIITKSVVGKTAQNVEKSTSSSGIPQAKEVSQTEMAHNKPKAPRRNELDRLHEDIRDMFISQGVLTATGKRMCTFVEPCPTKPIESEQINASNEMNEKVSIPLSTSTATSSQPLPRLRKSRVMLPRTTLRISLRKPDPSHVSEEEQEPDEDIDKNTPNDTSFSSDITQFSSTTSTTAFTVSTVTTDTSTVSSSTSTKSGEAPRLMPVLKALKPIRLREEDELDEWLAKQKNPIGTASLASKSEKQKKKRYKPCPKSRKPLAALLNDDDDADVEDTATDIETISPRPKIKTELLDISVPYEDVNANAKDSKKSVKNTNPKWHWASRYAQKCVLCKQKAGYMSAHYKKHHNENYVSRLAPIILEQLKQQHTSLNKPFLKLSNKNKSHLTMWLFRCPFCLQFKHTNFVGWLEHFITHTGEYLYECTLCHKSFNKPNMIERHMKEKCAGLGGRYLHNDEINRSFKSNGIKAYVCHICNYIRLGRSSLEHHYMEQHGYDVKSINDSVGYTISLMAAENVPVAKKLEELIQMEAKLNKQYQTDIIFLSDDDGHVKAKEKSTDNVTERTKSPITIDDSTNENQNIVLTPITAQKESSAIKTKTAIPAITKESSTVSTLCEKVASKEKAAKSQAIVENSLDNVNLNASTIANSKSANSETSNAVKETAIAKLPAPVYSAFVSTTDDSNDGEAPTILAKKLLTVDDERDLCNKSPTKPRLSGVISMAERLSQRLKEAEASTPNTSAQQRLKDVNVNTAVAPIQQPQKDVEYSTESTPSQQQLNKVQSRSKQTESNLQECAKQQKTQTDIPKDTEGTKDTAANEHSDKSDEGEVDSNDEDDDGWEDIEIVETAPSAITVSNSTNQANKDAKTQKNKNNPLQKLSRLYATMAPSSKSHKNSKGFKPLVTIFGGANNANKETSQTEKDSSKTTMNSEKNSITTKTSTATTTKSTTLTATTTSISTNLITTPASTPVLGFRPMIANLADLLPDSPLNDPIELAPELAPSSPLQELNDITSLLGTNLSGLMDIDVEDPANSVCIHNTDNQQTSIQEALDFIAAQTTNYDVSHNFNNPLDSNIAKDDCLSPAPMSVNRIQNIGYTCSTSAEAATEMSTPSNNLKAFKFYCFSDRCTFLYSSEAIGLENHFLLEHPQSKWNGYCNTCACQIKVCASQLEFNFSDEFNHLLEVHVKQSNLNTQTPISIIAPPMLQNELNSSSTGEQPRLKLRRLSGDCLSTATVQSGSSNNIFFENDCDSTNFSDLIRFNPPVTTPSTDQLVDTLIPSSVECFSNDVPFFTNVSKDFQITSISSGLEPTELSAIVKSALSVKPSTKNTDSTNPCTLQISNVISLGESSSRDVPSTYLPTAETAVAKATELSLPKITNVRSLNGSSATERIGALWSKQVTQEHAELAQSAAESLEITSILENASRTSYPSKPTQPRINNDSPGPMVVSETLPVGQATSGNFVITQTVSAQYSEESIVGGSTNKPKLGFNISISSASIENATPTTSSSTMSTAIENLKPQLNCMEINCKFTTRHLVAIIDHVKWHEKQNDATKDEYLRCSLCKLKLLTVDSYTQHLRIEHFSGVVSTTTPVAEFPIDEIRPTSSSPITSCALTNKIRNLLSQNHVEITAKESPICAQSSSLSKQNLDDESVTFKARLLKTIKEMVSKTGMCENKLFRCVIKDCSVKLNESTYHTHVLYHLSTFGGMNTTFPCPHCKGKYPNISALKTHIKVNHIRHNIFCYLCMETAANDMQMSRHFAQKHWQKKELNTNIIAQWESIDGIPLVYYVTNSSPLTANNIRDFSMKLITEWQRKKAATRTHFNPDEIELLPIQAIFSKDIFCALCLYKTKVRTNMVRHMMQHKNTPTVLDNSIVGSANAFNHIQKDGNVSENTGNMIVCSMDPVNPVPCLISNEKHFDRMTNLASSSLGPIVPQSTTNTSGGNSSPTMSTVICKLRYSYIPQSRRFKCGVPGCEYLTIYEDIFRSHLHALHSDVRFYQCLFCKEELCKRSLVEERVVQHLRFHDRTLYQCEQCDHSHYIRHVVERHALEKHGLVPRANILMFVRDEEGSLEGTRKVIIAYAKKQKNSNASSEVSNGNQNDANGNNAQNTASSGKSAASNTKSGHKLPKFICDLCQHTTVTYNQLIAHSNAQHGIKQPYQCPYCLHFTAWSEQNVKTHINEEHPGELLKVNRIFGKMSSAQQFQAKKEFSMQKKKTNLTEPPPRPLWQRDDPKRARQIRGIPMEDEEETEKLRKRLNDDYYDEEYGDGSGESASGNSLGQSASNLYLNRFEFGCFHCEYKTNSIEDLKTIHWESIHNNGDIFTSKPFLFRLLVRLKCAECQNFNGCFWEIQRHMIEDHAKPTNHAVDPRARKMVCGYCDYDCSNATQLLRHHLREDHQPQDIKELYSVQMAKVMRLECTSAVHYVHCSLCSELFNSRLSVVQHAGEKHVEDTEHFSFRELTNTTIYRCAECQYTATDELTTLRHMIDHYRRFKRCNFCNLPQTNFNEYMQHCYSDHRAEIRRFSEIYPLNDIRKYLMQVLIIFPNGWIINKKNLRNTPYGNEERIKTLYVEICKTSQEPPIPRLSLGRLVARKSIEAKQQQQPDLQCTNSTASVLQLAGNKVASTKKQFSAQKVTKRRCTIAIGNGDERFFNKHELGTKKQKLSTPLLTNLKMKASTETKSINKSDKKLVPYSFYGQNPEKEKWSKLHTKVSLAGINTPISLEKFKTLVNIDAYVTLEKMDIAKYKLPGSIINSENKEKVVQEIDLNAYESINQYENVNKACPASQKYRFV